MNNLLISVNQRQGLSTGYKNMTIKQKRVKLLIGTKCFFLSLRNPNPKDGSGNITDDK